MTVKRFVKKCVSAERYLPFESPPNRAIDRGVEIFVNFVMWVLASMLSILIIEDKHHLHPLGWVIFGGIVELSLFIGFWYRIVRDLIGRRNYRWRERLSKRPDLREHYQSVLSEARERTLEAHRRQEQERQRTMKEAEARRKAVTF